MFTDCGSKNGVAITMLHTCVHQDCWGHKGSGSPLDVPSLGFIVQYHVLGERT